MMEPGGGTIMKKTTLLFVTVALIGTVAPASQRVEETRPADPDARVNVEIVSDSTIAYGDRWPRATVTD